jgi:hypothetical protein
MLVKSTLNALDNRRIDTTVVVPNPTQRGGNTTTDRSKTTTDRELKRQFKELVLRAGLTARELADASGCTLDAAKLWLAGKRLPNLASTINMGQRLPVIRNWVQTKMNASVPDMRTLGEIVAVNNTPEPAPIPPMVLRETLGTIIIHMSGPQESK